MRSTTYSYTLIRKYLVLVTNLHAFHFLLNTYCHNDLRDLDDHIRTAKDTHILSRGETFSIDFV